MKKERKEAVPVSDIVGKLMQKIDAENKIGEEHILNSWRSVVGERAAGATRPVEIRNGKLRVMVENPGWVQELLMKKREILKKLGMIYGRNTIRDIGFTTQQG